MDADVTGRMAGRRLEPDFVRDPMLGADEIDEPGLHDGVDRVHEVRDVVIAAGVPKMLPVIVLALAEEIARLWKGRYPLAVHLARIPADVVEVQVRAHHGVD